MFSAQLKLFIRTSQTVWVWTGVGFSWREEVAQLHSEETPLGEEEEVCDGGGFSGIWGTTCCGTTAIVSGLRLKKSFKIHTTRHINIANSLLTLNCLIINKVVNCSKTACDYIKKHKADRKMQTINNIAGRLPENSRNRFVDRPSKKAVRQTKKIRLFIEGWSVIFWLKICISYGCLYYLISNNLHLEWHTPIWPYLFELK